MTPDDLPCTYDFGAGDHDDPVLDVLVGARRRIQEGWTYGAYARYRDDGYDDWIEGDAQIGVCPIGALLIASDPRVEGILDDFPNIAIILRGLGYEVPDSIVTEEDWGSGGVRIRDVMEIVMSGAAKEAIRILDDVAVRRHPYNPDVEFYRDNTHHPIEGVNEEIKKKAETLACYDQAIAERSAGTR